MAEDINSSASFGQNKNDGEELPIIVAQRFLNIFRQLHIFSDERREAFNKMLLDLPQEVKNIFQSLPGGTPLQEYMEDLEQKSKGLEPVAHHEHKKNTNILQEVLEAQHQTPSVNANVLSGDFAKILASSLAQSNAEIIKELQNSRPQGVALTNDGMVSLDGPMKLIADESFTNIISKALTEAIESSEKKRLEDNKMIAQSFLELQENLTKLIEQGGQVRVVGGSEKGGFVPIKSIVDDLVKAQSEFLKETTKNQKDELSSIIATAIKESQKVSTQALIDSFKQINTDGPAPITYAAVSPKGNASTMENVEQALKAQGKEFSSIISMALKESQKNSAQTIIETLENFKKDSAMNSGQSNLKVEEIMRMQANLFRDIARAQNQEFSALISSALKESQKQSTQAIIAALEQLQSRPVQTVAVPIPTVTTSDSIRNDEEAFSVAGTNTGIHLATDIKNNSSELSPTPLIDKYMGNTQEADDSETDDTDETLLTEIPEENSKKKKKKKKKKNKSNNNPTSEDTQIVSQNNGENIQTDENSDSEELIKTVSSENINVDTDKKSSISDSNIQSDKISDSSTQKENIQTKDESSDTALKENVAQSAFEDKEVGKYTDTPTKPQTSMLEKLMTISTAFSSVEDVKDNDVENWGWGTPNQEDFSSHEVYDENVSITDQFDEDTSDYTDGQDWEWKYEEVPESQEASGEEGQDWEWEYEEVPEGQEVSGEEGQDWEWEYEEVPEGQEVSGEEEQDWEYTDNTADNYTNAFGISFDQRKEENTVYNYNDNAAETVGSFSTPQENFFKNSEIVLDKLPQLVLLGLEREDFQDPYIENNDNIR